MLNKFKVKTRETCKICGIKISRPSRYRSYCSKKCRQKFHNQKNYKYQLNWSRDRRSQYNPNKKKCIICGGWYIQIGNHIVQRHKMTAREYREEFDLPVKRGILPEWFRKLKGEQAIQNKTFLNLKKGTKFWFKKGDSRSKITTFWKGRRYQPDEYYG